MLNFTCRMLLFSSFVIGLSANGTPLPSNRVLLRLDLKQDSVYQVVYSIQEMMYNNEKLEQKRMENTLTMHLQFKVVEVMQKAGYQLEFKITRLQSNQSSGGKLFTYDSKQQNPSGSFPKVLTSAYEQMVNHSVKLQITPQGSITEIDGEPWPQQGLPLQQLFQQIIQPLPETAVQIGDIYQKKMPNPRIPNRDINFTYRVSNVAPGAVALNVSAALAEKSSPENRENFRYQNYGTLELIASSGWLKSFQGQATLQGKSPSSGNYFLITNYHFHAVY